MKRPCKQREGARPEAEREVSNTDAVTVRVYEQGNTSLNLPLGRVLRATTDYVFEGEGRFLLS